MRVALRPVVAADVDRFYEHRSDPEAAAMAGSAPQSRDEHAERWRSRLQDPTFVARAIEADGETCGNLVSWSEDGRRLVGYRIGRQFWGLGITSAALSLFIAEVSQRPLHAFVAVANRRSIRVLEKAGFRPASEQPTESVELGIKERLYVLQ